MASIRSEQEPVCIFSYDPEVQSVHGAELERRLCGNDESIKDLKVVPISINGRLRLGKSFLMNYMLRYLRANRRHDWLADKDAILSGFSWKPSRERVTRGVLIWPEVFKVRQADGTEVGVILIDTEGMHDSTASLIEDIRIFSFSLLLSSIPIFNVSSQIQGDDYRYFESYLTFGRYISRVSDEQANGVQQSTKPFQELVFLIRDARFFDGYGWEVGREHIQRELNQPNLSEEVKQIITSIQNNFESISCFPMPRPDTSVDFRDFKGSLKEIKDSTFVKFLKECVEGLLSPDRLKVKRIHECELTVHSFCNFVDQYANIYSREDLPEPRSIFDATVETHCLNEIDNCTQDYATYMDEIPGRAEGVDPDELFNHHMEALQITMEKFKNNINMCTPAQHNRYAERLENSLLNRYQCIENENNLELQARRLREEIERARRDREAEEQRIREENEEKRKRNTTIKLLTDVVIVGGIAAATHVPVRAVRLGLGALSIGATLAQTYFTRDPS